jgi:hypothetical protein
VSRSDTNITSGEGTTVSAYTVTMELSPGGDITANPSLLSWSDYTDYVKLTEGIDRSWGRQNRFPSGTPAGLAMTLINTGGLFVPDNPMSALYGLIGEGTPIRVMVAPIENSFTDDFNRTASSAWNNGWTNVGTASDYSVSTTNGGRHLHAAASVNHWSTQAVSLQRIDITVRVRVNALSTGAAQTAGAVCRYADVSNSCRAEVQFGTTGALTARVVQRIAGADAVIASATVVGLTHSTSAWYRIRLQTGYTSARLKVWLDGATEPRGWNLDGASGAGFINPTSGAVGVYSRRETGNTNANATVDFDDYSLLDGPYVLQTCNVDEWPMEWSDASGNQALARITASGRLQQLQASGRALRSAFYRSISRSPTVIAYLPMEDKSGATVFAPGLSGGPAGLLSNVSLGADSNILGSEPLPTFAPTGRVAFTVPSYTSSGTWAVCWVMRIPASSISGTGQIMSWITPAGSIFRWQLRLNPGSPDTVQIDGFTSGGTVSGAAVSFVDSTTGTELTNGRQLLFQVNGQQNGGNVDTNWTVSYVPDNGGDPQVVSRADSLAGNVGGGRVSYVYHDAVSGFANGGHTIGHLALGDGDVGFGPPTAAAAGYASETTADRASRLSAEEKVPFWFGEILTGVQGTTTQQMGPQGTTTLYQQLQQVESTETGILFDGRQGQITVMPRSLRYNHTVNLVLDLTLGHLGWPWRRTRDKQAMATEVTVSSPSGATVIATGPAALTQRVGIKPQQVEVNAYQNAGLAQHAAWWLALGTSLKARYPQIPLRLHTSPDLIRKYLEMDVGGRIQVLHLPAGLPPDTLELIAEGGTDTIDPFEWVTTINASDGSQWLIEILDGDRRLDCGACVTSGTMTTTAPSMAVAISDTCTWTHSRGDFGVLVAGERMTVTNVSAPVGSGSSWTQTLTVTRSINGVVKAHAAGEAVHVADPITLGL